MADRIFLLRHADSLPSQAVKEADWALSKRGKQQAQSLITLLDTLNITTIKCSPYKRAIQTVKPFASRNELKITLNKKLREKKLTDRWLSNHTEEIQKSWSDFDYTLSGGESNRDCQQRIIKCIDTIANQHKEQNILISSHGNVIGLYLHHIDPDFGFQDWSEMKQPDLFEVRDDSWKSVS